MDTEDSASNKVAGKGEKGLKCVYSSVDIKYTNLSHVDLDALWIAQLFASKLTLMWAI